MDSTSSSDSEDEEDSSSSDNIETSITSWTYICKSFTDILNSGDRLNVKYVFKSAEQAVLNEEPIHSLKLFAMGLKQICDEVLQDNITDTVTFVNKHTNVSNLIEVLCLAINQCAILIASESKTNNLNTVKQNVKQCLQVILDSCETLSTINSKLLCSAASLYFSMKDHQKGFLMATKAVQVEPSSTLAQETYENMCCHLVERWHFSMLNDCSRNQAYQKALCQAIESSPVHPIVCDVGCGTGLLSLIASDQPKCNRVFAIEKSSIMCMVADDILRENLKAELRERVKIINKMSTSMSVPDDINQRADILVTETFDAGLFGEGILPTLCHAWTNLLKRSVDSRALVIPSKAELFIQVVECDYICKENRFAGVFGSLDLQDIYLCSTVGMCDPDPYTTQDLKHLPGGYKLLSDPVKFIEVDFNNPEELIKLNKGITQEVCLTITKSGRLDALAMWFTLQLNESVQISTHMESNSCWEQAIFPVHAVKIQKHPESKGSKPDFNVVCGNNIHVVQCVKGGKLCMDVTSITKPEEKLVHDHQNIGKATLRFLSSVSERLKHQVYCLSSMEIANLNHKDLHSLLIHQIEEQRRNIKGDNLDFVHLNIGSSLLCLTALQAGYRNSTVVAHNPCHQALLEAICRCNNIDTRRLNIVDDIDGFVGLLDASDEPPSVVQQDSHGFQKSEKRDVLVLCDVVDNQGRVVENLSDQLNVLKYCLSDYSVKQIIPHQVDIYGVLIESQDLVSLSRILSNENTLGYKIGPFFNKFSTKNYQGIMLSTLPHKKLTETFKILSINFNKIFHIQENSTEEKVFKVDSPPTVDSFSEWTLNRVNNNLTGENANCSHKNMPSYQLKEAINSNNSALGQDQNIESQCVSSCNQCRFLQESAESKGHHEDPVQCQRCLKVKSSTQELYQNSDHDLGRSTISASHGQPMNQTLTRTRDDEPRVSHSNKCNDTLPAESHLVSPNATHQTETLERTSSITEIDLNKEVDQTLPDTNCTNGDEISEMNQIQNVQVPAVQSGSVTALVYWFDLHISPTASINTSSYPLHWQQAAVMTANSPTIAQGEVLNMEFKFGNSALAFSFSKHT